MRAKSIYQFLLIVFVICCFGVSGIVRADSTAQSTISIIGNYSANSSLPMYTIWYGSIVIDGNPQTISSDNKCEGGSPFGACLPNGEVQLQATSQQIAGQTNLWRWNYTVTGHFVSVCTVINGETDAMILQNGVVVASAGGYNDFTISAIAP